MKRRADEGRAVTRKERHEEQDFTRWRAAWSVDCDVADDPGWLDQAPTTPTPELTRALRQGDLLPLIREQWRQLDSALDWATRNGRAALLASLLAFCGGRDALCQLAPRTILVALKKRLTESVELLLRMRTQNCSAPQHHGALARLLHACVFFEQAPQTSRRQAQPQPSREPPPLASSLLDCVAQRCLLVDMLPALSLAVRTNDDRSALRLLSRLDGNCPELAFWRNRGARSVLQMAVETKRDELVRLLLLAIGKEHHVTILVQTFLCCLHEQTAPQALQLVSATLTPQQLADAAGCVVGGSLAFSAVASGSVLGDSSPHHLLAHAVKRRSQALLRWLLHATQGATHSSVAVLEALCKAATRWPEVLGRLRAEFHQVAQWPGLLGLVLVRCATKGRLASARWTAAQLAQCGASRALCAQVLRDALFAAVEQRQSHLVGFLLQRFGTAFAQEAVQLTPLLVQERGSEAPTARAQPGDLLHVAVRRQDVQSVELLLRSGLGARPDADTVAFEAVLVGNDELLRLLHAHNPRWIHAVAFSDDPSSTLDVALRLGRYLAIVFLFGEGVRCLRPLALLPACQQSLLLELARQKLLAQLVNVSCLGRATAQLVSDYASDWLFVAHLVMPG